MATFFDWIEDNQPEDEAVAAPGAVPGPTDGQDEAVYLGDQNLPGTHQPNDGSGIIGDGGAIDIGDQDLPGTHQPGDGSGILDPTNVPPATDQDPPAGEDPGIFDGNTDVVDTPNPFGDDTIGFDAYRDDLTQNRANTNQLNEAASDFAMDTYGNFSRWDVPLIQQGMQVIEDTLSRLGRSGTNNIEATLANRGLTGSSVEADQMRELQAMLDENARGMSFDLAREAANTYASDRATAADIGLATAGLLGQTESDRFGQDFAVYGRDLDENFRRTGLTLDEDFRRDAMSLDEGFRQDQLGLDRDRFGFSQDMGREAAWQDRFGVIQGLAAEYPDLFDADGDGQIDPQWGDYLNAPFGFPNQFGQEGGGSGNPSSGGADIYDRVGLGGDGNVNPSVQQPGQYDETGGDYEAAILSFGNNQGFTRTKMDAYRKALQNGDWEYVNKERALYGLPPIRPPQG